jgi:hypothetical protein
LGILGVSFESLPLKFMLDQSSMSQDAVLGGDNPAPLHSLVLGGLGGLQQRFETGDEAAKLAALQGAIAFGDEAIGLLSQALTAESLQVRAVAYALLKQMGSEVAIVAAGVGIPLKVGDRIYAAYRSALSYGDDFYTINDSISDWYLEECPLYRSKTDENSNQVSYITDDKNAKPRYYDDEGFFPVLLQFFLEQPGAEALSIREYKQAFLTMGVDFWEIARDFDEDDEEVGYVSRINIADWCDRHSIEFAQEEHEDSFDAENRLLNLLLDQEAADLLYDIWPQLGHGALAFVHEYEIDRPCYLCLTKV